MRVEFSYGRGALTHEFGDELLAVLRSGINSYTPEYGEDELVERAVRSPIGSPALSELARGCRRITIIASDHTRPVPSRHIIPVMLRELRRSNPDAEITILIATGCHRSTTLAELESKFGEDIVRNEKIVIHDCDDEENLVSLGVLPSGAELRINRAAAEADLLVSEGFIEPHFFAGFSGGRKSVLPGVAARKTVLGNHCSAFIASDKARTGILDGNPINRDMEAAARMAKLRFIVNVVINDKKRVLYACAGDPIEAHRAGCGFLSSLCRVRAVPADVAISTNGGYPLDQNVYQAVKGMTAAEATVKPGGVIIMCADTSDGHGGESFLRQITGAASPEDFTREALGRGQSETLPDQWEVQIFFRVMSRARIIYISEAPDRLIREMRMTPAHSLDEALGIAKKMLGKAEPTITAIPDGVSVIVE
ncbi:MAG: nickel-dependent lactate racemase [Candidatus Flemingiibacterium sp.]